MLDCLRVCGEMNHAEIACKPKLLFKLHLPGQPSMWTMMLRYITYTQELEENYKPSSLLWEPCPKLYSGVPECGHWAWNAIFNGTSLIRPLILGPNSVRIWGFHSTLRWLHPLLSMGLLKHVSTFAVLHSSPMERAFEAGAGTELKEEDRDNSIFVSAFKRHLQYGSLKERLDTLLTDAAAGGCAD